MRDSGDKNDSKKPETHARFGHVPSPDQRGFADGAPLFLDDLDLFQDAG
jgi:hypothetical protein